MKDDGHLAVHQPSLTDPMTFWAEAAVGIDRIRPPEDVLDPESEPLARWFGGGALNTCHNALDRHVAAGHGDRNALIYDSPVTGSQRTCTYEELLDCVSRAAGIPKGVVRGNGGHAVALRSSMSAVYGVDPGEGAPKNPTARPLPEGPP